MERKAITLRIDASLHEAIRTLSECRHVSINRLIAEAVQIYVIRESREVERQLEDTLKRVRAYRTRDPDFEEAIRSVAEAEAVHDDPVEGEPFDEHSEAQGEVRRLLNG